MTTRAVFIAAFLSAAAHSETPRFEVASVKRCTSDSAAVSPGGRKGGGVRSSPGILYQGCDTLESLIRFAYLTFADGKTTRQIPTRVMYEPIKGGPEWVSSERSSIQAKAAGRESVAMMRGPMMQSLLEDRFQLKLRRETDEVQVYFLTIAKGGPKLHAAQPGKCTVVDFGNPDARAGGSGPGCGMFGFHKDGEGLDTFSQTTAGLSEQLAAWLDRDVVDNTGLTGKYDIHLDLSSEDIASSQTADPLGAISRAIKKVRLKLEAGREQQTRLVIDSVAHPAN